MVISRQRVCTAFAASSRPARIRGQKGDVADGVNFPFSSFSVRSTELPFSKPEQIRSTRMPPSAMGAFASLINIV